MLSLVLIAVIVIQLALCFGEMFQLTVLLTAYILSTSVHDFQKKAGDKSDKLRDVLRREISVFEIASSSSSSCFFLCSPII